MNKAVVIYTTRYCGFCAHAKRLLKSKGVDFDEIAVDGDRQAREALAKRSGRQTVPQIWIGEQHIGGCDDLYDMERSGKLDGLLNI